MQNLMEILRNDPDHRLDLDQAIRHGINGCSKKKPDVANDNDQWITNEKVYKSVSHSSGVE